MLGKERVIRPEFGEEGWAGVAGSRVRRIMYVTPDMDDIATWITRKVGEGYRVVGNIDTTWKNGIVYVVEMVLVTSVVGTGLSKGDGE